MPRHATSLGAGNFPAASKLLKRYEQDKAYKLHQQKLSGMRHRLDTESPKKYNHLLLRLKQVQKDEERQAQIDYENKLLLTKMTTIMKYGGSLDNYNNYELRSLNYPHRNKVNDEILRENIGIAKRLETVKPKYRIDKWEKDYQQHAYLKRLWNDSVKDFGEYSPRRMSRMSKAVKRSMDDSLDDGYQEDFESVAASEEKKKLPKLGGKHKANLRATQSEADGPVSRRGGTQGGTKLPKIIPHKQMAERDFSMYYSKLFSLETERIKRIKKSFEDKKKGNSDSKSSLDKEKHNSQRSFKDTKNDDTNKTPLRDDKDAKNETKGDKDIVNPNKVNKDTLNSDDKDTENSHTVDRETDKTQKDHKHPPRDIKDTKQTNKSSEESPYSSKSKHKNNNKKEKMETLSKKDGKKTDNSKDKQTDKNELKPKKEKLLAKSLTSVQSVNVAGNDIENVKTLISEDYEKCIEEDENISESETNETNKNDMDEDVQQKGVNNEDQKGYVNADGQSNGNDRDDFFDKTDSESDQNEDIMLQGNKVHEKTRDVNDGEVNQSNKSDTGEAVVSEEANSAYGLEDNKETENDGLQKTEDRDEISVPKKLSYTTGSINNSNSETDNSNSETKQQSDNENTIDKKLSHDDSKLAKEEVSHDKKNSISSRKDEQTVKGRTRQKSKEDGTSGNTGKEDTTDVAQLFKIAKQLGRPEDIFIKTLIKKSHKQRMTTKAKFRQKYDLDLISELKTGLGLQWELLIKELLEDRGFADAMGVFDAMCDLEGKKTQDVSDIVVILSTRNNAAMADLKESYRKEFSLSLEEDIMDRTQTPVQSLLLALQKGERDESDEGDLVLGHNDAVALFESGEGRWTSENGVFLKLVKERSPAHMQSVLNEYKTVSGGEDILDVMKQECPKDYFLSVKTYINCTRSPPAYFAELLHSNKLPSNPVFVSTLVARSEIDMPAVRKAYKKKYHVDLVEDIKSFSYPTTKCLMELAAKVPPTKKDNQMKKTYIKPQHTQQAQQPQSTAKKAVAKKSETATVSKAGPSPASKEPQQHKAKEPVKTSTDQQVKDHSQQTTKSKADADNQAAKAAVKSKETVKNNGTVKPASNFNAEDDCDKLNRAVSSDAGADESVVVAIIPKRSNKQRQEIKKVYEQKYKKNLMIDLESELQGDMEEIIFALLMTPTEYDAYCVQKAVEEMGTSEATLIGILCTRSSKELKAIKDYYKRAYKSDMDKDISGDCRGDFGDLVMELCKGEREPGSEVNKEQAKSDAKELYKDGSLDLKGDIFKTLVTKRNHAQINATFIEYEKLAGNDIYTDIANVMQDEDGYVGVAKAAGDPVLFYTESIKSCFTSTGTNDNTLIRLVVPRSEIDLLDIKAKYVELCSKGLWDVVNREVKGDYKSLLLAIINK